MAMFMQLTQSQENSDRMFPRNQTEYERPTPTFRLHEEVARKIYDAFSNSTLKYKYHNTVGLFDGTVGSDCESLTFEIAELQGLKITKAFVYLDVSITSNVQIELLFSGYNWTRILRHDPELERTYKRVKFIASEGIANYVKSENFTGTLDFSLRAWNKSSDGLTQICSVPNGLLQIHTQGMIVYFLDTNDELYDIISNQLLQSSEKVRNEVGSPLSEPCANTSLKINISEVNELLSGSDTTLLLPEVIDIGTCAGNCTGIQPKATLHQIFLEALFASRPSYTGYRKCCVPVEYSPVAILALRQMGNDRPFYVLKLVDGVSVKRCECTFARG